MEQNKGLGLLVCYFGKLPWYFEHFIHSCKFNPSVDFFIITDNQNYAQPIPPNVRIVNMTIGQVNALATEKLGLPVKITYGYKLCDFKPAYGLIFSDLLRDYKFWGHCDLDIIFGNIGAFITAELMDNYDLISVRPDWIPGCFLLFRNTAKMNTLFMHSKDYIKVFTSDLHYCFDETNFAHDDFTDGKTYQEVDTEIESMMHVVKKMESSGFINPYFDLFIIEGVPGKLKWENGIMTYRNKYEILLYHLIRLKKNYHPKKKANIPNAFTISPSRIYYPARSSANNWLKDSSLING